VNASGAWTSALLLCVLHVAQAAETAQAPDVAVTGKKVTAKDLEGSNPVAAIAKDDIMSMLTTGKPACKNGSVTARFEAPSSFVFVDESVPLDQLAARIRPIKDAGKISCFYVTATSYDKAVYARLNRELVDGMGVSLFWNEPDAKH
jgi:hypothetical protein